MTNTHTATILRLLVLMLALLSACSSSGEDVPTLTPTAAGCVVSTLAGTAGMAGSNDGIGAAASFFGPIAITVHPDTNLYVADYFNSRIRRVSPAGVVTTVAGTGTYSSSSTDGGLTTATFSFLRNIAAAPDGTIYVVDNNAIRRIVLTGASAGVTTLAGVAGTSGWNDGIGAAALFDYPQGIAVAPDGYLYVADASNRRIRRVSPAGVVTTVAGTGTFSSTDGSLTTATFEFPRSIAVAPDGSLYMGDFSTIRRIVLTGASAGVTTLAGVASSSGSTDGTGAAARFSSPSGIALAPDGSLYVADVGSSRIRRVSLAGVVTTVAGTGTPGSADGTSAVAQFTEPAGLATAADGRIYVVDRTNTIRRIACQ